MSSRGAFCAFAFVCVALQAHAQTFVASPNGATLNLDVFCSTNTPCAVNVGGQTTKFTFPTSVSAPATSASDLSFIYIDTLNPGVITVGTSTMALTCGPGATCRTGITSFPIGSWPLYRWPIVNGQFAAYAANNDMRATATTNTPIIPAQGVILTTQNGQTTAAPDCSVVNCTGSGGSGGSSTTTPPAPTGTAKLYFQLQNTNSGMCITAMPDYSFAQEPCSSQTNTNQQFALIPHFDSTGVLLGYELFDSGSNSSMDVYGQSTANGAEIGQYPFQGSANELFSVRPNSNGSVALVNKNSGSCIDITGVSTQSGVRIQQYACYPGDVAQAFNVSLVLSK